MKNNDIETRFNDDHEGLRYARLAQLATATSNLELAKDLHRKAFVQAALAGASIAELTRTSGMSRPTVTAHRAAALGGE